MKHCTRLLTIEEIFNQEAMLNYRKKGLTSFELAGIMGIEAGKNANATWLEKTERKEPRQYDNYIWTLRIRNVIREEFCRIYKKKAANGGLYKSEENPIMIDFIDGFIDGEDAGLSCLSIKDNIGWEDEAIPLKEYTLAQWCMAITGMDMWYVAVLANENELIVREVDRNEDSIQKMIQAAEDFWNGNVKLNRIPTVDASQYTEWALASLYDGGVKEKYFLEDGKFDTLCKDIIKLRTEMQLIKRACDAKINKLKLELKDHELAATGNYAISWSKKPRIIFNKEQFEKDYPSLAQTYTLISFYRPLLIKAYSKNPAAVKSRAIADAKRKEKNNGRKI